jgi:hypothetical protein
VCGAEQTSQRGIVQRGRRRKRIDALEEADLAAVDVPEARLRSLIQQGFAHGEPGSGGMAEALEGLIEVGSVSRQVRAQAGQPGVQGERARVDQLHGGRIEASRDRLLRRDQCHRASR